MDMRPEEENLLRALFGENYREGITVELFRQQLEATDVVPDDWC